MVHQHFMLVPVMTRDREHRARRRAAPRAAGCSTSARRARRVRELSERYGLAVDPDAVIEDVTVGTQQRVEILKTLYRDARILVLDEPTAVLTAQEAAELFEVLRALRGGRRRDRLHQPQAQRGARDRRPRDGAAARQARSTRSRPRARPRQSLARLMVGRDVLLRVDKPDAQPGEPVLEVEDLHVRDDRELEAVRGVSLTVRGGRDRGAGGRRRQRPAGAGRGDRRPARARVRAASPSAGEDVAGRGVRATTDAGVAHIAEDRHLRGLVLDFTLAENLALREYRSPPLIAARLAQRRAHQRRAPLSCCAEYDVRGGDADARRRRRCRAATSRRSASRARSPSNPQLLIAHQPTRGLDVGAIEFVHRRLVAERDAGPRHPAGVARVRGGALARRPHPRDLRGRRSWASSRPTRPRRSSASR